MVVVDHWQQRPFAAAVAAELGEWVDGIGLVQTSVEPSALALLGLAA